MLVSLVALNPFLLDCKELIRLGFLCVLQMYVFDKAETFCNKKEQRPHYASKVKVVAVFF